MIQPPPVLTAAGQTRLILMVHGLVAGGSGWQAYRPSDRLARLRAARETLEEFGVIAHPHLRRDLTDAYCHVVQRHPGWSGWAWGHCRPGPMPLRRLHGLWVAGNGGPGEMAAARAELVHALVALVASWRRAAHPVTGSWSRAMWRPRRLLRTGGWRAGCGCAGRSRPEVGSLIQLKTRKASA